MPLLQSGGRESDSPLVHNHNMKKIIASKNPVKINAALNGFQIPFKNKELF